MLYTITVKNLITDIKECDWLTKNDLFVEIKFGDENRRTTVKWNNNKPDWNESFIFNIDLNINTSFFLTINDADQYSKDEKITSEKIKINTSKIQEFKTDYLSISHGITNFNLYDILESSKNDKEELKVYNNRLIKDINDLKKELLESNQKNKDLKKFMFQIKKNIIKELSKD